MAGILIICHKTPRSWMTGIFTPACCAVMIQVPVTNSQAKSGDTEEHEILFEKPPTFNGLLDEIEKENTSVRLSKTDFQLKVGKLTVTKDSWENLARSTTHITLDVSFPHLELHKNHADWAFFTVMYLPVY